MNPSPGFQMHPSSALHIPGYALKEFLSAFHWQQLLANNKQPGQAQRLFACNMYRCNAGNVRDSAPTNGVFVEEKLHHDIV